MIFVTLTRCLYMEANVMEAKGNWITQDNGMRIKKKDLPSTNFKTYYEAGET